MLAVVAMTIAAQSARVDVSQVDAKRLRATVEKLASWHDRNTNNPTLTEAAEWIAGEFRKIPGMQVELMRYPVKKGARIIEDKEVVQVVATLPGASDRRLIMGGHFDTINMTNRDLATSLTLPSPGANDDASGVAATLESARLMAQRKWGHTLVFVAFSGEEQGLLGSTALAQRAKAENWKIDAVLSNDTVGSSKNLQGFSDPHHIRLFSEDPADNPSQQRRTADAPAAPRHNSRELARFMEWITRDQVKGFNFKMVFRKDRFGRGGDHTPFNNEGFTAIRIVEPYEDYTHQHTAEDLPQYMDWNYLANVTRLNLLSLMTLAEAEEGPHNVRVSREQSHDTDVTWEGPVSTEYEVFWRETTSPVWQFSKRVGPVMKATLPKVSKDDYVIAVGAVGGVPIEAR